VGIHAWGFNTTKQFGIESEPPNKQTNKQTSAKLAQQNVPVFGINKYCINEKQINGK